MLYLKWPPRVANQTHVDLDDGVDGGGVDEPQVGEVPPRGEPKVLDGAERDDLAIQQLGGN